MEKGETTGCRKVSGRGRGRNVSRRGKERSQDSHLSRLSTSKDQDAALKRYRHVLTHDDAIHCPLSASLLGY